MTYDPTGTGAGPDDLLVRRGIMWESAARLSRQAAAAEQAGNAVNGIPYGHGVSVTSPAANQVLARDPNDSVAAARSQFEAAGFQVRYTPTRRDDDHHTIILPDPVTNDIADLFNTVLGRSP